MRFRWPAFDSMRKLSPEEATELAARVAELTKAGLPLGSGLRALADESSDRRLPRVLRALASRLDAGDDLGHALELYGPNLPIHLRGLMLAGVRSGRLAEVLEEFVDFERGRLELRRRVWLSLTYPFILVLFLAALSVVGRVFIVDELTKIFADFGVRLPAATVFVMELSGVLMWSLLGLVGVSLAAPLLVWVAPGVSWIWPVLYRVPMLGPLLRYNHLVQFGRLMALLLEQQVSLPDALRLTAAGLRDANLARGCRLLADDVEKGRSIGQSMARRRQFPASLSSIVEWGQRAPALAEAFRAAADMFEGRARSQENLLEAVLLPLVFLATMTVVALVVATLFMPFITLFQCLT